MNRAKRDLKKKQVVCVKWGDKYPPYYVNRLYNMVMRSTSYEVDFYCITDDPHGLNDRISILPLPDLGLQGWWYKLSLFSNDIYDFQGRLLYIDLDVVIVDNIDALLDQESNKLIIGEDLQTGEFNSSVFNLEANSLTEIWTGFLKDRDNIVTSMHGDQDWISQFRTGVSAWPSDWIVSYKKQCNARVKHSWGVIGKILRKTGLMKIKGESAVPKGARIVQFHGKPDPEDVVNAPYGLYRSAPWIKHYWND